MSGHCQCYGQLTFEGFKLQIKDDDDDDDKKHTNIQCQCLYDGSKMLEHQYFDRRKCSHFYNKKKTIFN